MKNKQKIVPGKTLLRTDGWTDGWPARQDFFHPQLAFSLLATAIRPSVKALANSLTDMFKQKSS